MSERSAPELGRHEGSWVVVHTATRQAVLEVFCQANADTIMSTLPGYEVMTIGQWLAEFNARARLAAS